MFYLPGKKIVLFLSGLLFFTQLGYSQANVDLNLPFSDARWLHYGFSIGLHSSNLRMKYSDNFVTSEFDTVHSIMPKNSFGFSLGFIVDFSLVQQLNLRVLPKVSFNEWAVDFNYTNGSIDEQLIEATYIEIPILLKYSSPRHGNFKMYFIGGITPGFEVSGKKRKELSSNKLLTEDFNLSADVGIGVDLYFPLFKFSPEIRLSRGLLNLLREDEFGYSKGIKTLKTNVISFYFQFSD